MYTLENLKTSLTRELSIIKHLFTKIPPGTMDYRPTEKQRTTLELLQYISIVVPAAITMVSTGDTKTFHPFVERSKTVNKDNFISMLEDGEKETMVVLDKLTPEELLVEVDLFRMGQKSKGVYLVETSLKWVVAYKMQLFLYIKSSGNTNLGTSNLWGGFDMEQK